MIEGYYTINSIDKYSLNKKFPNIANLKLQKKTIFDKIYVALICLKM